MSHVVCHRICVLRSVVPRCAVTHGKATVWLSSVTIRYRKDVSSKTHN